MAEYVRTVDVSAEVDTNKATYEFSGSVGHGKHQSFDSAAALLSAMADFFNVELGTDLSVVDNSTSG